MIKDITGDLEDYEEILNVVRGLARNVDEKGNVYYTYIVDGVAKKLEELDTETLDSLNTRVSAEANRLNTNRIMNQLEDIRNAQRATAGPPSVPAPPPVVPAAAPQPPPTAPKSPPQPPAVPPSLPERR